MKVLLIQGSPKHSNSTSAALLEACARQFPASAEIRTIHAASQAPTLEDLSVDVLVFSLPLYVDGLPASLLEWLIAYKALANNQGPRGSGEKAIVYAIVNCGFYEGVQNEFALKIMRNFATGCGLVWGAGLGIGEGGMFQELAAVPDKAGIKRQLIQDLAWLGSLAASKKASGEIRYSGFAFPRFAYIFMANLGWKQDARKNHLKVRKLYARPAETMARA